MGALSRPLGASWSSAAGRRPSARSRGLAGHVFEARKVVDAHVIGSAKPTPTPTALRPIYSICVQDATQVSLSDESGRIALQLGNPDIHSRAPSNRLEPPYMGPSLDPKAQDSFTRSIPTIQSVKA
jgi:hypothetical protein